MLKKEKLKMLKEHLQYNKMHDYKHCYKSYHA